MGFGSQRTDLQYLRNFELSQAGQVAAGISLAPLIYCAHEF